MLAAIQVNHKYLPEPPTNQDKRKMKKIEKRSIHTSTKISNLAKNIEKQNVEGVKTNVYTFS